MISKKIVLRGLFPGKIVVMILFIRIFQLLLIIALPNQQGHTLLRVIHGRIPLVLTILFFGNEITVPLQLMAQQKSQSGIPNFLPNVQISLVSEIRLHHTVNHRLQGNLQKKF